MHAAASLGQHDDRVTRADFLQRIVVYRMSEAAVHGRTQERF